MNNFMWLLPDSKLQYLQSLLELQQKLIEALAYFTLANETP